MKFDKYSIRISLIRIHDELSCNYDPELAIEAAENPSTLFPTKSNGLGTGGIKYW